MEEKGKKDLAWVASSILAGFGYGIGNYLLGIYLSDMGLWSVVYTGIFPLTLLIIYRLVQCWSNIRRKGCLINTANSNWFRREVDGQLWVKFSQAEALLGNSIPATVGIVMISLAFEYASFSGIN